ncbi:MAG: RNA polymerase sigma factor [Actinomycetes bacterium]
MGTRTRSEREREDVARDLFHAFYPQLAGWVARLVGDRETAHDIATEAFTRLLTKRDEVAEPRAWLYATSANLVRDHWRKLERERRAYSRTAASGLASDADADGLDLATRTTVRGLVEALPDRLREPVLLHYFADLPISQVATLLGKAEGTIKRALFDARALMAASLQEVR